MKPKEPKSMGGALMLGLPVCFTSKDKKRKPQIIYNKGDEAQALDLLIKLGIVEVMHYEELK